MYLIFVVKKREPKNLYDFAARILFLSAYLEVIFLLITDA
ncbi:hypothetical protein HMPREF1348_00096 [Enterococcus faecium 505]|uniref:Uncharacterized protein n=1 Tax=Enterococcus faecium 505 TaxID=1134806 RepID=J7CYF6_ENTFC|nr:hypothetical protein HMPREF1348_00096 [Enterococcus faecium 505]MBL5005850.1 hypothetical protein [Enterococcus lactis]